ncbi:MAG: DNA gyrase C-terminal beta-propeller domain-containing protein [Thermoplasmata archaeon]
MINLLPRLKDGERVQTLLTVRDLAADGALFFATRRGLVKRTTLDQFQNIRTSGIQAILLEDGDELVDVALLRGEAAEIVLATYSGLLVRFPLGDVRPTGRATYGVIGVRLSGAKDDRVVAMAPVSPKLPTLLSLTTTGYGKRSPTDDYRKTRRGAMGVRTIRTGGRNGGVVAVLPTTETSELLVTTQRGVTIRMNVAGIRTQSRNTLGVRVIRLDEGDEVRDAVTLAAPVDGAEVPAAPDDGPAPDVPAPATLPDEDEEEIEPDADPEVGTETDEDPDGTEDGDGGAPTSG